MVGMYITRIPNRGSPPAILLREGYRQDGTVKTRTLANLSKLPPEAIELLRLYLKGHQLVPAAEAFDAIASLHHGHVEAVLLTMRRLGFASLLASRSSRPRELVLALVAARILEPESKLATTRSWQVTSLPTTLGVADADEDELYTAMDWLLQRQDRIEHKLAARHLHNDGLALYDLSSSYFEGLRCPLASLGHNRDGKKGKLQVNYGLLTNARGLPVSVSVFKGNTADPTTLLPEVNKLRSDFGMQRIVLVGDRGMITQKQVDALREIDGIDWIAALRPEAIKKLIQGGQVQRGLFDERNLFELTHADFPGERLVACRNPELARRRADKRQSLLEATGGELERVRRMVERGRLRGQEQIGKAVQRVLNQYKIGKCYRVEIRDDGFEVQVDPDQLTAEQARDARVPPKLAQARQQRRQRHLRAIDEQLGKIRQRIGRGQLHGQDEIGVRGRQGRQQVPSQQALQARHPGRRLRLQTRPRQGCRRSRSRRDLCGADEPRQAGHDRRRRGSQLQATEPSGTGLSFVQDPWILKCVLSTTTWSAAFVPTFSCACSPTTSNGTCWRPGVRSCSPTKTSKPKPRGTRWRRPGARRPPSTKHSPGGIVRGNWLESARCAL